MGYCGAAGGRSDARGIVWGFLGGFGGVRSWGALGLMEGSQPYGVESGGWIGVCPGPKRRREFSMGRWKFVDAHPLVFIVAAARPFLEESG